MWCGERKGRRSKSGCLGFVSPATDQMPETARASSLVMDDSTANDAAARAYVAALEAGIVDGCNCDACKLSREILADKEYLAKKSMNVSTSETKLTGGKNEV